jgi:hypothetical protein
VPEPLGDLAHLRWQGGKVAVDCLVSHPFAA